MTRRIGVLGAALALMAAIVGGASATIFASSNVHAGLGMDLSCTSGQVRAYAPYGGGVFSSFQNNRVYIKTQVDRWDSRSATWVYVGTTSEWAYGSTLAAQRTANGFPLNYMAYGGPLYWISTGALSIQPNGKAFTFVNPWVDIPVASGNYYRVFTWLRDAADGKTSWIQNTTANGLNYCLA